MEENKIRVPINKFEINWDINRTSKTANIDCGKDNVGINLFLRDKYVTKFQEILEKNKNDIDNLSIEVNFMVDKKND